MSRSAIYAVNTTVGTAIADGGVYAPTTIIRRYGPSVNMEGDGIVLKEAGYYKVNATATVAGSGAGNITAQLYQDGVAVPGATASATVGAAASQANLAFPAKIRVKCNCIDSVLTVRVSGQATTSVNLGITVDKE